MNGDTYTSDNDKSKSSLAHLLLETIYPEHGGKGICEISFVWL